MAAARARVRTPVKQLFRRFCHGFLPALVFLASAGFLVWQFTNHTATTGMVGEVFGRRADIYSEIAGRLVPLAGGRFVTEFTPVEKGEIVAMLDRAPTDARIRALEAEMAKVEAELESTLAEAEFENAKAAGGWLADAAQLYEHQSRLAVEMAKTEALLATALVEKQYDTVQHKLLSDAFTKHKAVPEHQVNDALKLKMVSSQNVIGYEKTIAEIRLKVDQVNEQVKKLEGVPLIRVAKLLEPVQKEIAMNRRLVEEAQILAESLVVRAPFSGVITQVHLQPGQAVQTGLPILSIATTDVPYVITYIRPDQWVRPQIGMAADVRFRSSSQAVPGTVVQIGPQVEMVSLKQQFDPRIQEWGLPVAIALAWPQGLKTQLQPRPGELVTVRMHPDRIKAVPPQTTDVLGLRKPDRVASMAK